MSEELPGQSLSNIPEENEALDALINIERLIARGDVDGARAAYAALTPVVQKLDRLYETSNRSPIAEQIEDRVVRLGYQLASPPEKLNDGTGEIR